MKNRSGSFSVQVIDKFKSYRVVKTIDSSKDPDQISRMFELARLFIVDPQRGLKKIRQKVHSGRLTKKHLNNRGYNKFLRLDGKVKIKIDKEKIVQAARWDGLKGYLTNTDYSPGLVIVNAVPLLLTLHQSDCNRRQRLFPSTC